MKKILIIEDDPIVAHIYRTRLEKEGYQVISAKDGDEAIDKAKFSKPDLVILDMMMPKKIIYVS